MRCQTLQQKHFGLFPSQPLLILQTVTAHVPLSDDTPNTSIQLVHQTKLLLVAQVNDHFPNGLAIKSVWDYNVILFDVTLEPQN